MQAEAWCSLSPREGGVEAQIIGPNTSHKQRENQIHDMHLTFAEHSSIIEYGPDLCVKQQALLVQAHIDGPQNHFFGFVKQVCASLPPSRNGQS